MLDWTAFLQFLNLPIVAGVGYVVFQAGAIARQLKDHDRRIDALEGHVWDRHERRAG